MKEIPKKLEQYLTTLDDITQKEKTKLFISLFNQAQEAHLQSPRHWAMRQVMSGKSISAIERKFAKLAKTQSKIRSNRDIEQP